MKYIGAVFLTVATMLCALTIAIAKEGDHLGRYEWTVPYLIAALLVCLLLGIISLVKAGRQQEQRRNAPSPLQTITQKQEVSPHFHQEFKPTIQIGIGDTKSSNSEQEKLRHEQLILDSIKQRQQGQTRRIMYLVEAVAAEHLWFAKTRSPR
jgi:hypothetical protein